MPGPVTKSLPNSNEHAELVRVINQLWQAIGNTSQTTPQSNTTAKVQGGLAIGSAPVTIINGGGGGGGGLDNPMKNRGEMIYGEAAGKPTRLQIPDEGSVLVFTDGIPQWVVVDMTGWGS